MFLEHHHKLPTEFPDSIWVHRSNKAMKKLDEELTEQINREKSGAKKTE
jgi:hypothetical protein